jgi:hypothetical protein
VLDGSSTLINKTTIRLRRHLSGRYISSESECDYTSTSCACATRSFPYVEGAPEEAIISMAQHIKNGIDAEDRAVDRRARNRRDLGCLLRIKALRLYTSVITSSTTNVVTASSLISQKIGIVRPKSLRLARVRWASNRRAVLLRTGDACDLEDCVDDTTNTFTSNETSGNSVP